MTDITYMNQLHTMSRLHMNLLHMKNLLHESDLAMPRKGMFSFIANCMEKGNKTPTNQPIMYVHNHT